MPTKQEDRDSIDFQQYWLILKRRWLLTSFVTGSVFGLAALLTFLQKPAYESPAKLIFNKQNGISSFSDIAAKAGELRGLTSFSNPVDTEAEVIRSYPIIQKTITTLKLKDKKGQPLSIEDFLKNLKLKTIRGTDVMQISYRSKNPQESADVVNFLMKSYIESNISNNRTEARSLREFLSKQLPEVENRVLRAEMALRRFKEKNRVVALDEEAKVGVEGLNQLSQEIISTQGQLVAAKTWSVGLQDQMALSTKQAVELTTLSQSPGIQSVLKEYQKAEDDLAVAKTRYTNDNPTIINLEQKAQALRSQLEGRVSQTIGTSADVPEQNLQIGDLKQNLSQDLVKAEVERLALANRVMELQRAYLLNKRRLDILPALEQQQLQLERQLKVARITYEQVSKQLQESEIIENQKVGNARVLSEALVPDKPISPIIAINLALGGALGILLGIGVAILLEAMDSSLKTVEQAQDLLDYPLLGIIPKVETAKGNHDERTAALPVLHNPYSPAAVAFEMFQTNLGFSICEQKLKVIVVSSAVPGEGKSFIAANLATATAQLGKKVLLLDADMRRSRQHKIWQQSHLMGLSNILVGQADLQSTSKEVLINLDLLTSGIIPPNPVALLNSPRIAALLHQASNDYDFVIIDAPPLSAVADAQILGKLADGILLVVRPGLVDSTAANATRKLLAQSSQRVLGIVVNGVTANNSYHESYFKENHSQNGHSKNGKVDAKMPNIQIP
ncbi:hypothetical protein NIES22_07750 [Calothrix brevissima NIES-22]|nr:hypothetical protein NIES22_07750 [Calothrix brevissima NIES-22]